MKRFFYSFLIVTIVFNIQSCDIFEECEDCPGDAPNCAPLICIIAPVEGDSIAQGKNIDIKLEALDSDGEVVKIELYIDNLLTDSIFSRPYHFSWNSTNSELGLHTIKVIAYDNKKSTSSSSCTIEIIEFENLNNISPVVSIFKPSTGDSLILGQKVTIKVEALDADGYIDKILCYLNEELLNSINSRPYQFNWNTNTYNPGNYNIKIIAFDDKNFTDTAICNVTVYSQRNVGIVTDIDGNNYKTVKIGEQWWMAENLKVTRFPDGTDILYIEDAIAWGNRISNNTDAAFAYYENNVGGQRDRWGGLYNYAAAIAKNWEHDNYENQGICPDGWHLPSDEEWKQLENEIGMPANEIDNIGWRGINEGKKLKSTSGWNHNGNGTDTYGFNALPGGALYLFGSGDYANWWARTENYNEKTSAWYRQLSHRTTTISRRTLAKSVGLSVRCVKD